MGRSHSRPDGPPAWLRRTRWGWLSGPRHLAAAVGTATVAVYWGVHLGSYGPLYRARHRTPTSWRLLCPVCGAHGLQEDCRSYHDASFVADVTVDEVLAAALDLLATDMPTHRPDDVRDRWAAR